MKKIFSISVTLILAFILSGCFLFVSKRLIQEINFNNVTGDTVKIACQDSTDSVTIIGNHSSSIDVSNTDLIKIYFSDSNDVLKYDLSNLDIHVLTDNKPKKCIWGHIHWVYSCTINKDKTLTFPRGRSQNNGFQDWILKPITTRQKNEQSGTDPEVSPQNTH